ncbi:MAG: hypothetical protein ACXW11_03560 [Methylotenera sp.]
MTGSSVLSPKPSYDNLARTRLSQNFILRDFLFSTEAARFGHSNYPSDNLDQVIASGCQLCAKVLEPILEHFGRCAIIFGYMSRETMTIERGWTPEDCAAKKHSSSPHQWDRGTFGEEIYARVDILPFCVEDGRVSRQDFGQWVMHHLDIDLLMQYRRSNVYCITISPKPRRIWLEWVPWAQGDNGSNKIEYMGRDYWKNRFPVLPDEEKPKFYPSETSGKMNWPKNALPVPEI